MLASPEAEVDAAALQELEEIKSYVLRQKSEGNSMFVSGWDDDSADVDEEENPKGNNSTHILWAAETGKLNDVRRLVKLDQSLMKTTDPDGYTPLHRACYNNHVPVVEFLLAQGADYNATTKDGWTPLHSACHWNNAVCAVRLLESGANVNATTAGGQTPLHLAAAHGSSKDTLELLLMHPRIEPSILNKAGESPYTVARRSGMYYPLFEMHGSHVTELTDNSFSCHNIVYLEIMSGAMLYGGDEIGALVFDVGHHSLRVGHAQEDTPKADIPSQVGIGENIDDATKPEMLDVDDKKSESNVTKKQKYYIDTNYLCAPHKGVDVTTYMKDGMIEDWDLFEKVLDYTYKKVIHSESKFHPVLMSEAPWNVRQKREKLMELMFEKYNVPAFYLAKNAVLAAFANGRSTAIVVDSGATHTSAVPVQDGFVLTQAIVKSPLGGDYISMQCKSYLGENDIEVVPAYVVASKEVVKEKEKPKFVKRTNIPEVQPSWHNLMVKRVVQDFQMSCLQIAEVPYDEKHIATIPAVHYEFPNGYHQDFTTERFRIPEALFDPSLVHMKGMVGNTMLGVAGIVTTSIGMCDVDVRPALYNSVVLTGGNSFIQGFPERLNRDLSVRIPSSMRLKINACSGSAERRYGAWIGGSILASIGTFQQMWVSAIEYEEGGKAVVERKCP